MLQFEIPGREPLLLAHLVLDYNGTIALDGKLLPQAAKRITHLKEFLTIHILTADTHGTVQVECAHLGVTVHTFPSAGAGQHKAQIVEGLPGGVCCVGNGFNDIPMFGQATLSVAVIGHEGVCGALLAQADVVVTSIDDALDLLLRKGRLTATLRS